MMLGFVVGVTRMVLDFIYRQPGCDEIDTRPVIIQKVHYMYFACILFCITVTSSIIISLMTEPPEAYRVSTFSIMIIKVHFLLMLCNYNSMKLF